MEEKRFHNLCFEISSKAFSDDSEKNMYYVCRKMFTQWKNLTDLAEQISVMTWIADGGEILDYAGDLNDTFEWAYWIGVGEPNVPENMVITERMKDDQFLFPKKYRPDAALRRFSWLKRMIEVMRETAFEMTGKKIRLIATFDNGNEFSISDFKYHRHTEILKGHLGVVICNYVLHGDTRRYAAFPNGIPEGTQFGKFLGAQFKAYSADIGYDGIWLSNGMGFGKCNWGIGGFIFDKTAFHVEGADAARSSMMDFWNSFTSAFPGVDIETRGSNFSAGIEMSTDGSPLKELYREIRIAPPVNSPWAALNFRVGRELAAWMSHIAELPGKHYPYRFYMHDPWYNNSPWLDRYGREPWDIYLPLSVSRLKEDGKVQPPDNFYLLTVDNSFGQMPDLVAREVLPHLRTAIEQAPDKCGPFLWVYPFSE